MLFKEVRFEASVSLAVLPSLALDFWFVAFAVGLTAASFGLCYVCCRLSFFEQTLGGVSTLLARAIGDFGGHVPLENVFASNGCSSLLLKGLAPRLLTLLPIAQIWLSCCCWVKNYCTL